MSERFARGDYDQMHHFVAAPFQVHLFFAAAAKQIIGSAFRVGTENRALVGLQHLQPMPK